MKGLIVVGLSALLVVAVGGCVYPTGAPIAAGIYTGVTGPGQVVDLSAGYTRVGQSQAQGILVVATGDASINTAARNAGITKIRHVDVEYMNILGVFGQVTTTVYGE